MIKNTMKTKLFQTFGDEIIIATLDGKPDVVTIKTTALKILQNYHKNSSKLEEEDEKGLIMRTAANLLKMIFRARNLLSVFHRNFRFKFKGCTWLCSRITSNSPKRCI